jgi:hypothetical protein
MEIAALLLRIMKPLNPWNPRLLDEIPIGGVKASDDEGTYLS